MPGGDEVLSLFVDGSLVAKGNRAARGGMGTPRDERDDKERLKNSCWRLGRRGRRRAGKYAPLIFLKKSKNIIFCF